MNIQKIICTTITLILLSGCATTKIEDKDTAVTKTASTALKQLEVFLPGHYSNFPQHWQNQNIALRLLDIKLLLVESEQTWFLSTQQDAGSANSNERQQILRFRLMPNDRLELSFTPFRGDPANAIRAIEESALAFISGCEMTLHITPTAYAGETSAEKCRLPAVDGVSPGLLKDVRIQANSIIIGDQLRQGGQAVAPPSIQQFQRSHEFSGWAGVKPAQAKWLALAPFKLYSDGQTIAINNKEGRSSGINIRLSQVAWKLGETQILRLDLIDPETGKPTAYAFTDVNSGNIGLNLGHLQIGLKRSSLMQSSSD